MDIKARIEEVIVQKGLTKREVSERMGKFNQAFNSLITNPKWDTIEHVAEAIGINTEELLFGGNLVDREQHKSEVSRGYHELMQNKSEIKSQSLGVIICPHCGIGIKLSLIEE